MSPFLPVALVVTVLAAPPAARLQGSRATPLRDAIAAQARSNVVLAQLRLPPAFTSRRQPPTDPAFLGILGGVVGFVVGSVGGYLLDRGFFQCECSGRVAFIGGVGGAAIGAWLGVRHASS